MWNINEFSHSFDNPRQRWIEKHSKKKNIRVVAGCMHAHWGKAVYAYPLQMGIKLSIPLVIWGENMHACLYFVDF